MSFVDTSLLEYSQSRTLKTVVKSTLAPSPWTLGATGAALNASISPFATNQTNISTRAPLCICFLLLLVALQVEGVGALDILVQLEPQALQVGPLAPQARQAAPPAPPAPQADPPALLGLE